MRIFLAIEIPDEVKKQLDDQLKTLKQDYPFFNWVHPRNYHITLYFLGEVEKANLEAVKARITDLLYDTDAFELFSLNVSLLMDKKITIYAGFHRQKKLETLEAKIAAEIGVQHNYKYVPHVTLARWKIPSKQQYFHLQDNLKNTKIEIEFPVKHICLYQSILQPDAPVYDKIAEFPLLSE